MNNRKQQIKSFLDSLTSKELEDYLIENEINKDTVDKLKSFKKYKELKDETSHVQKLINKVYERFNGHEDFYLIGEANIIAMLFHYGLHKDFNIKDFVKAFDKTLEKEPRLKEYVYEIMKDF